MLCAGARWKDVVSTWPDPPGWQALDVAVTAPARPGLVVQAGHRRLRLAIASRPVAWSKVDRDYQGTTTLVARDVPRCLPPITADRARRIPGPAGSDAWWSGWARWLTQQLLSGSTPSPLALGSWHIAPCSPAGPLVPWAEHLEEVATQSPVDARRWDYGVKQPPLALRSLSSFDDARVKAWRRAAREGHLPPLFLLFVTGLNRYLILDGHVRLVAALAEGIVAPGLAVVPVRPLGRVPIPHAEAALATLTRDLDDASGGWPPRALKVERINRTLVRAFDDRHVDVACTRAWPLPGGVTGWDEEVRTELAARGLAPDSLS
jgi:hypothetical protein